MHCTGIFLIGFFSSQSLAAHNYPAILSGSNVDVGERAGSNTSASYVELSGNLMAHTPKDNTFPIVSSTAASNNNSIPPNSSTPSPAIATLLLHANDSVDHVNHITDKKDNDVEDVKQEPAEVVDEVQLYLDDIHNFIFPKSWEWALIACHFIVFVLGLLGNVLVCVAVYRNYAMRTVTNYFIVNLAVADFLVILFCLPPTVIWNITSTWFFGNMMCKTVLYIQTVSVTVSVLTLTLISIDRYYAICYPLRFKSTTRRAQTAICCIWTISFALAIPDFVGNETRPYPHEIEIDSVFFTQCVPIWSKAVEKYWTIFRIVVLYFLPLLLMSICHVEIIRVLWQSGTVTYNGFSMVANTSTKGQLRSRKKAAKMLVSVVGMFAVCFLPVHLLSLTRLVVRLSNSELNNAIAMISHWLCYANSALNPVIYNFMSGKFRKEFKRIAKCAKSVPEARVELNTVCKAPAKRAISDSMGRNDTTRTTIVCA